MEVKIVKEHLKCILTEKEIKESGANLARFHSEISDLENQKKSVVSDFKSKIEKATAEADIEARKIQNGYEYRSVECEVQKIFDEKVVQVVRTDTGEIIKQRAMTPDELQEKMFPEEGE